MPGAFDVLFVVSFALAVVGFGVIAIFVDGTSRKRSILPSAPLARPHVTFGSARFRAIAVAGFLLGLPTISDGFIFLSLQRRTQIAPMAFPLFYVMTSLVMSIMAVPVGRLADRIGRTPVLLGGYVLLAGVYAVMFLPAPALPVLLVSLALLGGYYAATDGVLTAMAASVLPPSASGTGLAVLATATNLARLIASVLFGLMWVRTSADQATVVYLAALVAAIGAAGAILLRAESRAGGDLVDKDDPISVAG
jgi:MFS family permease